jgi:SAM-dependent methyltransferase
VPTANQCPRALWTSGDRYEAYAGRWSRPIARGFIAWLGLAPGLRWLDVGCGTGALSQTILRCAAPAGVLGVDPAEEFVAPLGASTQDLRARFAVGNAQALPVDDATFDVVVSGLVLNFVADPMAAIGEMQRAVRPGGTIALYVWDYAGEMQMLRHFWNAAVAVDAFARCLDEGERFSLCRPDRLRALFADGGIKAPQSAVLDVPTVFRNFDDFWSPFLGGQGPAPCYLSTLPQDRQVALREHLRAALPVACDGSIRLRARAFVVRGVSARTRRVMIGGRASDVGSDALRRGRPLPPATRGVADRRVHDSYSKLS